MVGDINSFSAWAEQKLGDIRKAGITEDRVSSFLKSALEQAKGVGGNLEQLADKLFDAIVEVGFAISDMPIFEEREGKIYGEIYFTKLRKPISAEI